MSTESENPINFFAATATEVLFFHFFLRHLITVRGKKLRRKYCVCACVFVLTWQAVIEFVKLLLDYRKNFVEMQVLELNTKDYVIIELPQIAFLFSSSLCRENCLVVSQRQFLMWRDKHQITCVTQTVFWSIWIGASRCCLILHKPNLCVCCACGIVHCIYANANRACAMSIVQ